MGEQHQAGGQHRQHDAKADAELHGGHVARAEKAEAEALDDGRERIELQHPAPFRRHGGQGQNHRRGIHHELNAKGDKLGEVAVARRQRRDDDAAA